MTLISESYRKSNETLHHTCPDYGGGGSRRLKEVCSVIDEYNPMDMLDYGSGKGDLTKKLWETYPHKNVYEYDPCIKGKTNIPNTPFDCVICNDVMEHVEFKYLNNVLIHTQSLTRVVCFFCIGLNKANKLLPDGRNTHITLLSKEDWVDTISKYFDIEKEYMIGRGKLCLICKPKEV